MGNRWLRVAIALAIVGVAAQPAEALSGCPGHLTNGVIVCHNVYCGDCKEAVYECSDGSFHVWNVCGM